MASVMSRDPGRRLDESLGEDGDDRPSFPDVRASQDLLDAGKQVEGRDGDEEVLPVVRDRQHVRGRVQEGRQLHPGKVALVGVALVDLRGNRLLEAPDVDGEVLFRKRLADGRSPRTRAQDADAMRRAF